MKIMNQAGTQVGEIECEVKALQVLRHPCITRIHDAVYIENFACVVLELYRGGNMMAGMMRHWKSQGPIPMAAVQHLTGQMWQAVAFLHSKLYLHRDLKADNFMMDLPQVENTANRIYLGDFGSAVELQPGARLSSRAGTTKYWSPEMYQENYAHKVDCWAIGVIMYGFFSQKFPFRNEEEVMHKELQIHSRICKEGEQLIRWALERDDAKRCEAAEAADHPFNQSRTKKPVAIRRNTDCTTTVQDSGFYLDTQHGRAVEQ